MAYVALRVTAFAAIGHPQTSTTARAAQQPGQQRLTFADCSARAITASIGVLRDHALRLLEGFPRNVAGVVVTDQNTPVVPIAPKAFTGLAFLSILDDGLAAPTPENPTTTLIASFIAKGWIARTAPFSANSLR